ncbi:hypothetical protein ACFQ3Z_01325 [Streptomyces nogalater]
MVARSSADWVFVADSLTFVASFGFLLKVRAEREPCSGSPGACWWRASTASGTCGGTSGCSTRSRPGR